MRSLTLLGTARRALATRLQQLATTLENLGERLREAVAQAVGQTVGGSIRAALQDWLTAQPLPPPPYDSCGEYPQPRAALWDQLDDLEEPWGTAALELPDYDAPRRALATEELLDSDAPGQDSAAEHRQEPTATWSRSLAFGLQAAAWWLQRRTGRHLLLAALGVGLLTAAASWACNPVIAAGLGVMVLANTLHTGARWAAAL